MSPVSEYQATSVKMVAKVYYNKIQNLVNEYQNACYDQSNMEVSQFLVHSAVSDRQISAIFIYIRHINMTINTLMTL